MTETTNVFEIDDIMASSGLNNEKYRIMLSKLNSKLTQINNLQKNHKSPPPSQSKTRKRKTETDYDPNDELFIPSIKKKKINSSNSTPASRKSSRRSIEISKSNNSSVAKPQRFSTRKKAVKPLNPNTLKALDYCREIIQIIRKHKYSAPFLKPVDPVALKLPDYFDVVKEPMDLTTISLRMESNFYGSVQDFVYDMNLIWNNAMLYNHPESSIYDMAQTLSDIFNEKSKQALKISERTTEETKQEMIDKIDQIKIALSDYELKIIEIKEQFPKEIIPFIEVKKNKSTSRKHTPVSHEEKTRLSNIVNDMDPKYYSGIVSIIEQDMPSVLNTEEEVLELDIDELEFSTLWRILDFFDTHILEKSEDIGTLTNTDSENTNKGENNAFIEDSSSSDSDSDSDSSDSDDESSDKHSDINENFPSIVPFKANIEKVEIQNVDSWSNFNIEEEDVKVDTDSDIDNEAHESNMEKSDSLWQEFKNKGLQNQLRAQQEEKVRIARELQEKQEIERIKMEEEKRILREKELEEEKKKKRQEEINKMREEERRKRERDIQGIESSQQNLMDSFSSSLRK